MMPQVLSALFLALVTFGTHTTRASPLPQDTGSSIGGLFGSLLVGLGERAVQEGLVDRLQELGVAGGQAVLENGVLGQIQDQAVDSAISGGGRAAGTVGNQVMSNLPSSDAVLEQVVSNLPSSDALAEQVVANLPSTDDVISVLPSTDEVTDQVVSNLPTSDQVVSNLPTSDQVIEVLPTDQVVSNLPTSDQVIEVLPTDQVVNQVRGSLPTTDQVVDQVGPSLPTAQQIGGQLLNLFG